MKGLKPDERDNEVAQELKRRNPGFDGALVRRKYVQPEKREAIESEEVEFVTDRVADLTPIRVIPNLRSVVCIPPAGKRGILGDLGQFAALSLDKLQVGGNKIRDLAPLRGTAIRLLYFARNDVTDLAPIADLPIVSLNCQENAITTLAPLKGMKSLGSLDCSHTAVADLSPLRDLPLVRLKITGLKPADLSVLPAKLTELILTPETAGKTVEGLRGLKALATINGKPAAEFWKEFDGKK